MAQIKQYSTSKRVMSRRKWLKPTVLILLGLILVIAALELTNTTHFFHKEKAVSSTIAPPTKTPGQNSSTSKSSDATSNTAPTTGSSSNSPKDTSPTNPSAALVAPYGNFVSNHHPGENGSPSVETSVCTTTPGAKCTIRFVSQEDHTVVKTLTAGTADSSGAVYWNNWDVKDAGFTNGAWDILVVATLGNQTQTTQDKITFQVSL